uniref:Trypsin-co-occurring domain-containing protein n=1 Tax=Streptomyces sp. NBC_00003 TaxID=2903608 RepID=A0AAU2UXD7_9ACTN
MSSKPESKSDHVKSPSVQWSSACGQAAAASAVMPVQRRCAASGAAPPSGGDSRKFGIKATGANNWIIAKSSMEGGFEVTLTWRPAPEGLLGRTWLDDGPG